MEVTVHPTDLEPAQVGQYVYVTRRRLGRIDAATLFGVMICLLTLIPSLAILPSTSADIGRPAVLICVLMFCWWIASRCHPRLAMTGPQPMRWAVLIYLLSALLSYAIGLERGLTGMEANAADRALIGIAAFLGVILLASDGLSNWGRVRVVLQVFVWCAAFMSVIGLLQQILPFNPVEYLSIPGLQTTGVVPLEARGSAVRAPATTTHFLELSATLSLAWPFAIHLATFARTTKERRRFLFAAALITLGILVTISRSGIIAAGLAIVILMPIWSWRKRYNIVVFGLALFGLLSAITPPLALTFFNMFADADKDPSITSRTDRYDLVGYFFSQRPWLGRGTGTWVPPMYQYLDNQWLRTALENGVVGVAALAILHIIALAVAGIAFRRATEPADRHLCLALVTTQLMAMFLAYTFDVLTYSTYATALGITAGLCGAVWRFTHPARTVRTSTTRWFDP